MATLAPTYFRARFLMAIVALGLFWPLYLLHPAQGHHPPPVETWAGGCTEICLGSWREPQRHCRAARMKPPWSAQRVESCFSSSRFPSWRSQRSTARSTESLVVLLVFFRSLVPCTTSSDEVRPRQVVHEAAVVVCGAERLPPEKAFLAKLL